MARDFPRFCRSCAYPLRGLEVNRCPECGGLFDPEDPATYSSKATSPRARRYLRLAGAAAALLVLILTGASAVQSYRQETVYDVGVNYASLREATRYTIWDITLYRTPGVVSETHVTRFLRADNVGPEQWAYGGSAWHDWRGREVDYYFPHPVAGFLPGVPIRAENLDAVADYIPAIRRMIRKDILHGEHRGVGAMLTTVILFMCDDPSPENLNRQLEDWQRIKEHPQLFYDS